MAERGVTFGKVSVNDFENESGFAETNAKIPDWLATGVLVMTDGAEGKTPWIALTVGTNRVAHGLGRKPVGAMILARASSVTAAVSMPHILTTAAAIIADEETISIYSADASGAQFWVW